MQDLSLRLRLGALTALMIPAAAGCGLDITFEDSERNRDLIAAFDVDAGERGGVPEEDTGTPDATPDLEPEPEVDPGQGGLDHRVWGALARRYTSGACFDYDALNASPEGLSLLRLYLDQLFRVDLGALSTRAERVALWINAYNALTVLGVAEARRAAPGFRVDEGGFAFFRKQQWDVGGLSLSLDMIEHVILRGALDHPSRRNLDDEVLRERLAREAEAVAPFDPRVHFALNCASRSCPNLRAEAFRGASLEAQLADQSEVFLLDASKGAGAEGISSLFLWFRPDFERVAPVPEFIEQHRPGGLDGVDVGIFLEYDWSPNDVDPLLEACQPAGGGE